jgi:hypothetical protein
LTVFDESWRELWRHNFPDAMITGSRSDGEGRFWSGYLKGDTNTEILFAYTPLNGGGQALYCFSENGIVNWGFIPGRGVVSDKEKSFIPPYHISSFAVTSKHDARFPGPFVVVSANNSTGYPNQVAILNGSGTEVGEYWHSGHLPHIVVTDLDSDGVDKILLGGEDFGSMQATLVVLDPRRATGVFASREPAGGHGQIRGFGTANEKAVLLFPALRKNLTGPPFLLGFGKDMSPEPRTASASATA